MKLWFAFHFPSPQLPSYFSKLPRWVLGQYLEYLEGFSENGHLNGPYAWILGPTYKALFWNAILSNKNQILPKGPQEVASEVSFRWAKWPQEMSSRSQATWKFFIIVMGIIGLQSRSSQNSLQIFRTAKSAQKVSGAQCAHKVIFTTASQWPQKMTWNYHMMGKVKLKTFATYYSEVKLNLLWSPITTSMRKVKWVPQWPLSWSVSLFVLWEHLLQRGQFIEKTTTASSSLAHCILPQTFSIASNAS